MIRAAIFDFNGVLVDDEHVHFELFREILAPEGVVLDESMYHERYLGYDDRGCFGAALVDADRSADRALIDALIAKKAERYAEVAETDLKFFPNATETVAALADAFPVAICSGALRAEIEYALKRLRVRDRVVSIVSAKDTTRCKPDPEGYLIALERLRARLPDLSAEECLAIEDSLAGVQAARSAGMVPIGVTHTYLRDDLLNAGAIAVVDGLTEITPEFLAKILV